MWKRLVQKRMNCGHILLIERETGEVADLYWVKLLNTAKNEVVSLEIEKFADLKHIGEAFLKAYHRAKKK